MGNHQTNSVEVMPNGTLLWHSGSTCNVCDEADERNAALLWVNATTGEHGVLASGVRNSFDGVWVEGHGYFFTDNGRDWDGDHPPEELNFLQPGERYGWPDDAPETPVPEAHNRPLEPGRRTRRSTASMFDPPTPPFQGLLRPKDSRSTPPFTVHGTPWFHKAMKSSE